MLWIMLNPSTADASQDDPTIRRCISFAKREGAGGLVVVNLYAFRATDPRQLLTAADPFGPQNASTLGYWLYSDRVSVAVAAWGAWNKLPRFPVAALALNANRPLACLGHTKSGAPRHPLYVAGNTPLELL